MNRYKRIVGRAFRNGIKYGKQSAIDTLSLIAKEVAHKRQHESLGDKFVCVVDVGKIGRYAYKFKWDGASMGLMWARGVR
jgi:hypothetical protein